MSRNSFTHPAPLTPARFALELIGFVAFLGTLLALVTLLHVARP